ncbi:MAG: effector binding domain-containing protein [Anaerorhabdus sp.]|uniref:GyrI-like domain-containing protein n=1 Tax=Anaerorhabdus sp. TaxID=1872524 RepID=UPI002FC88E2D
MTQPFRIEKRESFRVLGYVIETTNAHNEGRKAIPEQWDSFKKNNLKDVLMPLNNQEPFGLLGISVYNTDANDKRKFENYIAVSTSQTEISELKEYTVPACTWAVFTCTIETIGKTEIQAIMKWLPKSNYKPLNTGYITGKMKSEAPDIQYYGKEDLVEIWIAVKERK